ncbi:BREX-1 system phosphatase PglZ type A [Lamprobacter modestohalophilus]|uniref:BREX-1 system phosphatase PglZ type A n=1 Tax=Lamprobacter modestohalophilus TaxID=1064514 RepID=UPI002ADEEBD8|nr:BREX-1 system phosphatase PglZ type A [Lamprobacter modestohalophilus]MEA1051416.1 BREX-1 system phosphatase PglZ type A [Lamprobacter modestohalophilus]
MENRIAQALMKLFERHRIIFWYDAKQELREDFEALALPEVEKLELGNNAFGLKYRLLREQPQQKFLLYRDGPQPDDLDHWLLDVQLAQAEFRTDQGAIWLAELELGLEFTELVRTHAEFFQASKRREALKTLLKPDDTAGLIRLKMLAVCAGSEPRLDSVLEHLLQALAEGRDEPQKLIARCSLEPFLWEQLQRGFGYASKVPSMADFVVELFKSCYAMGTDGEPRLSGDALVFLKRWKDSRQFEQGFEQLSAECAEILGIEQDLARRDARALLELDAFRLIEQKIISDLVRAVAARTLSSAEVALWVRQRRQSHWYAEYQPLYEAVEVAAQFLQALGEAELRMDSLADGVQRYSQGWYRLDQLYRQFIHAMRLSGQASLLSDLNEQIENRYTNQYLLPLGDRFQVFVDAAERWEAAPVRAQRRFFAHWVQHFLSKDTKVCVIISDALRYEIGDELLRRIRREDRYSATLEPALAMLPSYTQLGMAALLPQQTLALADNDSGEVLADGQRTKGTPNRGKLLDQALPQRTSVCKADALLAMKGDDCRALVRDHDLIYVYHNLIDATGDKRDSEERVFEAVEDTLQALIRLIKKLTGANATNILVTADHGFLYQHRPLDESDFADIEIDDTQILYRDRRFLLGKGLRAAPSLRHFSSAQLGLSGEVEVQIPKSINRLRLQGSGSRFVHGGASLQEVVIPVLKINKKRQSDVRVVEVEILRGASSVITAGQLAVTLYQAEPVTDKVRPRQLRAGLYTQGGELISDQHDLRFDLGSDNPRDREQPLRFVLTRKADEANGQEVILKLEEQHPGTTHYKDYKSVRYLMRRSFTSDFDF